VWRALQKAIRLLESGTSKRYYTWNPVPSFARLVTFVLLAALLDAAPRRFQVAGVLDPPKSNLVVVLSSSDTSFLVRTVTDSRGCFVIRKLVPGAYSIWVSVPNQGEVLRTVNVGPSVSAQDGRIAVTVPLSAADPATAVAAGRNVVSVRELKVSASARKDFAEALKLLGSNDTNGAARLLRRAVSADPSFWPAWNELGTIQYHAGRHTEAEICFRKALEQEPQAFDPTSNLGGVLLNLGRYQEALDYNTSAVRQRPRDVLANSQIGLNYLLLNQLEKALSFLKEAKRLDPSHFTHPQRFLAEIYVRLSNPKAAVAELEDLVARYPDSTEAIDARRTLARLR
jgi:Tfp pilus assembly protein PilF